MSDEELKVQDAIVNGLIDHYKAVIEQYKTENSEDKIIRQTLENFMRGLWEEIQVGELEYTTSEVYEMLEREIFTDNHVDIPSAKPCEDAVSKQVVKEQMIRYGFHAPDMTVTEFVEDLPSVNPQPCDDAISRKAVRSEFLFETKCM